MDGVARVREWDDYLSPSGRDTFVQCQRRWRYRYLDRLDEPSGREADFGRLVHSILERLMAEAPEVRSRLDVCAGTAEAMREAWVGEHEHGPVDVWRAVRGGLVLNPGALDVVGREVEVSATVGCVPFYGVIDRIDRDGDGVRIIDYKTGKVPRPKYAAVRLSQLYLYAAALEDSDPDVDVVSVELQYVCAKPGPLKVTEQLDRRRLAHEIGQFEMAWDDIHGHVECLEDAAADEVFRPRPGPLCGWCGHVAACNAAGGGPGEVRR